MKTKILKWDVFLQRVLIGVNVTAFALVLLNHTLFYILFFSIALSGVLQIVSNVTHLTLRHKSIGYRSLRLWHFWCSLLYAFFFFVIFYAMAIDSIRWAVAIIIPEAVFLGYFILCNHELKYLEHREFHILR